MTLSPSEAFFLYRTIFQRECISLIKSKEYTRFVLTNTEKKFIERNHKDVADFAAKYYIENHGINLSNEDIVQNAVEESLRAALQYLM